MKIYVPKKYHGKRSSHFQVTTSHLTLNMSQGKATTSGQVLQANHPKNSWDLNHPQVPVIPRSSMVIWGSPVIGRKPLSQHVDIHWNHQATSNGVHQTDPPFFSLLDLFKV